MGINYTLGRKFGYFKVFGNFSNLNLLKQIIWKLKQYPILKLMMKLKLQEINSKNLKCNIYIRVIRAMFFASLVTGKLYNVKSDKIYYNCLIWWVISYKNWIFFRLLNIFFKLIKMWRFQNWPNNILCQIASHWTLFQ